MIEEISQEEQLELCIKGSIVGLLVGDAVAWPYSNTVPKDVIMTHGPQNQPLGCYSYIGALNLATIDALNDNIDENSDIILDEIMSKFESVLIANYLAASEDSCNLGPRTIESINNYTNSYPIDRCGSVDPEHNDNECLIRILPVALYYASHPLEQLITQSHVCCSVTHNLIYSQAVCALFSLIVRNLLLQRSENCFDVLVDYYKTKNMNDHAEALRALKQWQSTNVVNGTNMLFDTFWSAWKTYSNNETDFRLCITDSVLLGNESAGVASLAGALCGLSNGLNDIPQRWLQDLRLSPEAMGIIQKFTDIVVDKLMKMS